MKTMVIHFRAITVLALLVAGLASPAFGVKNTGGEYNTLHAGLGAKGYDVVSYFTQGKPVPGLDKYKLLHGGVTWRFSSAKHRDLFAANPEKYAPQYGGFCSWGVAQGKLFDVDPVNGWTVHNGRLYLNFNGDINKTFRSEADSLITQAEKNWPALNQ
jgi:YHS domain-containing protein